MNVRSSRLVVAVALVALSWRAAAAAGDVLFLHGHIYTGNPAAPWAQALSVRGSRIEAVGTDADIAKRRSSGTRVIDLHGRTALPGIVDSHIHVLWGAYALYGFNLSSPDSLITPDQGDQFIAAIKAYAAAHAASSLLFGRADFSTVLPGAPDHELLDRAVADRPIVILNTSGHAYWLNSAAMAAAGVSDRPVADADEERGVVRDASGNPSGVFLEAAMELVSRNILARVPTEEQLAMLRVATHHLNSFGITSVVNATGDLREIGLFATLRDRGQLTVRTRTAFGAVSVRHRLTPQFLSDLDEARRRYHDSWVSAGLVKFFTDGSTGLIPPLVYEAHEYADLVLNLDKLGYQVMTHTQRIDALHMILNAYQRVEETNPPRDRRMRIEHVFLAEKADIPRFGKLGVIAAMQPSFCCSDMGSFNYLPEPIPTDQWRSLEDSGATLAFGSDWPCTWPPDPFVGIQEAATRQIWRSPGLAKVAGEPFDGSAQAGAVLAQGSYLPEERISVEDAVRAYTRGAAYAAFLDDRVGTLEPGKEADIAVLSQDIFSVAPQQINKTKVLMTMVGGKSVYEAWN
jgi:predicted amidohydrolase YtcJ